MGEHILCLGLPEDTWCEGGLVHPHGKTSSRHSLQMLGGWVTEASESACGLGHLKG